MEQKQIKILISVTVLALLTITNLSFAAKEVPYTLEDRDRLIRVEEGLKAVNQRIDGLDKAVNQRIDGLDGKVNGLQNLIYVLIGAVIAQTIGIVGFTLWDRRSALAPAIRKNKEIEEREEKIEKALKEVAQKDPNVAEALKHVGLL
jgi:tetrahydromethanopterin S-methyltransferase subunit G